MSRKIYTKEFKEQAVKLSYVSGKSVAEAASDLGLPVNMLHRWRREAKLTGRVFPGRGIARWWWSWMGPWAGALVFGKAGVRTKGLN